MYTSLNNNNNNNNNNYSSYNPAYIQHHHHNHYHYHHHSFAENGFSVIHEEQMPATLPEQNNHLSIQNDALLSGTIQPSSSSSSSSLNNHNLRANKKNSKSANYGSSSSNTTNTTNSLASDLTSASASSPQHQNLLMGNETQKPSETIQTTPIKNGIIGGILSSISSSFSLSNSTANNNNSGHVKLRLTSKNKSKSEIQKRISLPANINNNHPHLLGDTAEIQYLNNNTPPLIENEEFTNENNGMNNSNAVNYRSNNVLNNNLNVRNNIQMSQAYSNHNLSKQGNHLLNYYNKSFNGNNGVVSNPSHVQSYQSLATIPTSESTHAMSSIFMMKPLNRNNRRASMSELGYGKIESYNKLDKLGEVDLVLRDFRSILD